MDSQDATGAPSAPLSDAEQFGVYIHWPFCLSKCPYCDFNSHVRHAAIDEDRFVRAFAAEIATTTAERAPGRVVSTIFFGGGTPSLMKPSTVGAILDAVGRHWQVAPDVEITLEANPTSVEASRFRGYRAAGVNRVSLGVQALDDRVLKELGRQHTARGSACSGPYRAQRLRALFVRSDLRAAAANAAPNGADELKAALREAGEHLSLYQLTIEPDTPFAALHAAGKLRVPDDDTARALYDTTQDICAAHGLPAYEISNHARPGAECRHNLVYWRMHEYAGIGPGAHGRLNVSRLDGDGDRHATATEKRPESWLARVERDGHGLVTRRRAHARRNGRRIFADGAAARRRHRSAALCVAVRTTIRSCPHCCFARAWALGNDARRDGCVSAYRVFQCSTRSSPILRR